MVTRTGEREIGAVSGRLVDNPGELACIIIIFWSQYMSNQYMRLMLFLKPDVKKKNREFFFSLFVLFDLLLTASNLIFELGPSVWTQVKLRRICMASSEHNWAWMSRRQLILLWNASFWQVGLLDIALFRISWQISLFHKLTPYHISFLTIPPQLQLIPQPRRRSVRCIASCFVFVFVLLFCCVFFFFRKTNFHFLTDLNMPVH